ncbi:hypothetical protein NPIL_575351 [Nephila pilipes]|uniref:Uncharacterized protein n=1 Tax=Nephila pilipes TaxID=299642 RepID=A0A8X6PVQ0_NEPPI|nr:hypothetical protein NPIL_575351 [Nephila pilipes]
MKHRSSKLTKRILLRMITFSISSAWIDNKNNMIYRGESEKNMLYHSTFRLDIETTFANTFIKIPALISSFGLSDEDVDEYFSNCRVIIGIPLELEYIEYIELEYIAKHSFDYIGIENLYANVEKISAEL